MRRDVALRESVFTIFHLNMVGLAAIQVLIGNALGALFTVLLGLVTIGLRVIQDNLAARRLRSLKARMRPRSTVLREGQQLTIPSDEIVVGDLVVVRPGDQFQVAGQLVGDGSIVANLSKITGTIGFARLSAGDQVLVGGYCMSGRGTYRATQPGLGAWDEAATGPGIVASRTPLERLIVRLLFGLLLVVLVFVTVLLAKYFRLDVGAPGDELVDAAPVIFSLLPTGLYLMILQTYAAGTADLARMGAFVRSARTVESLAESNVVCFTDMELLSGTGIEVRSLPAPSDEQDWPSAAQMRQMLGDFAHNAATTTPISDLLNRSLEGERREVRVQESSLAEAGWVAIAYDDPDDTQLYVLATPDVLRARLSPEMTKALEVLVVSSESEGVTDTLVLAWGSGDTPLVDATGQPVLPLGLVPLCTVHYRRRVLPEAVQVVRDFVASGVRIKVFTPWEPPAVLAVLRDGGFSAADEQDLIAEGGLSRAELERTPRDQWLPLVQQYRLFGGLLPDQVAEVIRLLRADGKHVTVVGDGSTDVPALQAADLAVAQSAGVQAAVGEADIVLLEQSAEALLKVLHRGQAMVRGLLDVIKLNLSLVLCSALLILVVRLLDIGFPYQGGQGSVISILAITIPSLLLPAWAPHGAIESTSYKAILVRFLVPVTGSLGAVCFLVYLLFYSRTASVGTAQLAVTYTLLYSALLLSVIVRPPWGPLRTGTAVQPRREWRPVIMVAGLALLGTVGPLVPLFKGWFKVDLLPGPLSYLVVVLGVVVWLGVLHAIWRVFPRVDIVAPEHGLGPSVATGPQPVSTVSGVN